MSAKIKIGTWPINIGIALQGRAKVEAERALNAAHGYPDGVPLDAEVPEALERAHYALHMGRGFVVHVAVYSDGTVELDGAGEPPGWWVKKLRKQLQRRLHPIFGATK